MSGDKKYFALIEILKTNEKHINQQKEIIVDLSNVTDLLQLQQKLNQERELTRQLQMLNELKDCEINNLKRQMQFETLEPQDNENPQALIQEQEQPIKKSAVYLSKLNGISSQNKSKESINRSQDILRSSITILKHKNASSFEDTSKSLQHSSVFHENIIQKIDTEESLEELDINEQQDIKLFEEFLIFGCNNQELMEFEGDQRQVILSSLIQYSFPNQDVSKAVKDVARDFAFPFGVRAEKLNGSNPIKKLKEIVYSGNKLELLDKFFIFSLQKEDQKYTSNQVTKVNPHQLLYGICLQTNDFLIKKHELIGLSNKQLKDSNDYWRYNKTFCFLTYFPCFELFQEILIAILNLIKYTRIEGLIRLCDYNDLEQFNQLGESSFKQEVNLIVQKFLSKVIDQQITEQLLQIDSPIGQINFQFPPLSDINTKLWIWSMCIVLRNTNISELIMGLLGVLNEVPIVVISERPYLLTALIHTLLQMIYPLKWLYPILYTIPESLIQLIQSPVPILLGICQSEEFIRENRLFENCQNTIFVFLDGSSRIASTNTKLVKGLIKDQPYFNGLFSNLKHIHEQFNQDFTIDYCKIKNEDNKARIRRLQFTSQEQDLAEQFLTLIHSCIQINVINKLTKMKERKVYTNQELKKDFLFNVGKDDIDFMQRFVETQMFTSLL